MYTRAFTNWAQVPVVMDLQTACIILGRGYDALKKDAREGKFPAFKDGAKKWAVKKRRPAELHRPAEIRLTGQKGKKA